MTKELRKILFIDDDADIHLILTMSLSDLANVEVRSAMSGEEGVKVAMEFQPDLIILDVMMPGMDGIATLQVIKLVPSLAKTPVVFLTAKAQRSEIESYLKYGIIDVISKPFNPITISEQVQTIWQNYQAKASVEQ